MNGHSVMRIGFITPPTYFNTCPIESLRLAPEGTKVASTFIPVDLRVREMASFSIEIAKTRIESGVVLVHERELPPVDETNPEASTIPCFWWRRGRVELPVQKAPW